MALTAQVWDMRWDGGDRDDRMIEVGSDAGHVQIRAQMDPGDAEDLLLALLRWDPAEGTVLHELMTDLDLELKKFG